MTFLLRRLSSMMFLSRSLPILLGGAVLATASLAALPEAHAQGIDRAGILRKLRTPDQRREFLRARMVIEIADGARLAAMTKQLDGMNPREINALLEQYLDQTQQNQLQAAQANAIAQAQAQAQYNQAYAYQNYLARRYNRGIGYQPIVTTLPSGVSLNAGGLVSPDGRYARISANPFFSSVGPVSTFNYRTGQTRYYPQQQNTYPFNQATGTYQTPQPYYNPAGLGPLPTTEVETYYDGIRTHIRRKQ
ncbi:hypothetical protein [Lignipirellula cremea]|uniref:Uncharacterized protein n=1 Tax=Lignipirellula cremea TaxID=2528010 RepID=A0A518DMA7_9BACT|nr:hypothetical protein [Lignipirellula cremea]QDU92976.1 hypothetical protein Pla8534_07490 [Lignipirellula cremea]